MAITLTESAADRVRNHLEERGSGIGLRLGIKKTGCSGFAYVVNYADEIEPDDIVFDESGVSVVVDPESLKLKISATALRWPIAASLLFFFPPGMTAPRYVSA